MVVDDIIRYESGEMEDDEIVAMFQKLLNDGTVWHLQGSYQRTAQELIDRGLITQPVPEPKEELTELRKLLHPSRFSDMSGKMAAVIGFLVGEAYTAQTIQSITITSDDFAMVNGGIFSRGSEIETNLRRLFEAAELNEVQTDRAWELWKAQITDWRPGGSAWTKELK